MDPAESSHTSSTTWLSRAALTPSSAMTPRPSSSRPPAGLPRSLNNLALQALVATFALNKTIVDESAANMAVVEVVGE